MYACAHALHMRVLVICACVQGSGADLLEHEGQYMQYHLLMVWRHLQDGAQALKVGGATGTNGCVDSSGPQAMSILRNGCKGWPIT